jgi:hypothetical protein
MRWKFGLLLVGLFLVSGVLASSDIVVLRGQYYEGVEFKQGTFEFQFDIYDSSDGGDLVYTDVQDLTTGYWGEWLAELKGVNAVSNDPSKDYFVEISIDREIQSPRQRLTGLDVKENNILKLELSKEPSDPKVGMIYLDADSKRLKLYDGSGWYAIALEKVSSISKEQVKETIEKKGELESCSTSTECGDWGDCINNYQSMTCIVVDENCNKYEDSETKDCVSDFKLKSSAKDSLKTKSGEEATVTSEDTISDEVEECHEECGEVCTSGEESCSEECSTDEEGNESCEEVCETGEEICEEVCEEVCEVPEELFDITFDLDENSLSGSDKLIAWITLQNFGKKYVPARLIYTIMDGQGEEIYREFEEIRVYSDESFIKTFSDLDLEQGTYNLKLEVEYAGIVEDFDSSFSVETGFWVEIKRFWRGIF